MRLVPGLIAIYVVTVFKDVVDRSPKKRKGTALIGHFQGQVQTLSCENKGGFCMFKHQWHALYQLDLRKKGLF